MGQAKPDRSIGLDTVPHHKVVISTEGRLERQRTDGVNYIPEVSLNRKPLLPIGEGYRPLTATAVSRSCGYHYHSNKPISCPARLFNDLSSNLIFLQQVETVYGLA